MGIPSFTAESTLYYSSKHYRLSLGLMKGEANALVLAMRFGGRPGLDGVINSEPDEVTVAYADISVECEGGKVYDLSSGTKNPGASCEFDPVSGEGTCGDNKGNTSMVVCGVGCTQSRGAGTCRLRAK